MHKPLLLISIAACLVSASLSASTFIVPSDREMVRRTDAIVIASPFASYSRMTRAGGIETVTPILIEEVIKGGDLPATIDIVEPGGRVNGMVSEIGGVPQFLPGERVLLFVRRTGPDRWSVTDLALGKFRFMGDQAGRTMLVRDEEEIVGWDTSLQPHVEGRRFAGGFLEFLKDEASGRRGIEDYFVAPDDPLAKQQTFSPVTAGSAPVLAPAPNATFSATSYSMTISGSQGSRWAAFPNGVTVYRGASGEPGAPGNGTTAVQTAISSWDNDAGSNVNYVYGGIDSTHTQGLRAPDGANTVLFERDLSGWGITPFTCSGSSYGGTLGIGGITRASGSNTVNGETFVTTLEGDVEMNRGIANCSLLFGNGDFNTAVAHELGHTLGFRHSDQNRGGTGPCLSDPSLECSNLAIMKASIPGGINAALQQWDINAVRAIYPGSAPPPPPPPPPPPVGTGIRGDINGDGRADLIWRNTSTGGNRAWFMNNTTILGTGTFATVASPDWKLAGSGDFNADRRQDLVWRNRATGSTVIWLMSGVNLVSQLVVSPPGTAWDLVSVVDFNHDGNSDLIWQNTTNGAIVLWTMTQATMNAGFNLGSTDLAWRVNGSGDFNRDGSEDLVFRNVNTGQVVVWLLSGTRIISNYSLGFVGLNWHIGAVSDLNVDGTPDLIFRNTAGGNVVWYVSGGFVPSAADLPGESNTSWDIVGPR